MTLNHLLSLMRRFNINSVTIHQDGTAHMVGRHGVVTVEKFALDDSMPIKIPHELFTEFDPSKPN